MLGVSFADRILFTGLLIRAWGTDLFSDWATLLAGSGILMTLEFGFQVLLGNSLVRAENGGCRRAFDRLVGLGICFYLSLAVLLVIGIGLLVTFSPADKLFHLVALRQPNLVFLLLSGNIILRITRSALTQIFRGKGEVHQLMWTDVRSMGAILVISAGAVLAGARPLTVAWIYLLGEIVFGELVTWYMVRHRFANVRLRGRLPTKGEARRVARELPWYGWLAGATHLMVHVPVLIVAWLGLAGAPLIALVVQRTLVNFGKNLSSAVSLAIGIEIADLGHASSRGEREQAIRMLGRFNVALAALMAGGLLFFGAFVVRLWTGKPDLGSFYILFWLLLPVVVSGPAIPLQMVTFYSGKPQAQAVASAVQVALGLVLAFAAGRLFGVTGAAFGVGVGEAIGIGLVLPLLAVRHTGVRYLAMFGECMLFFAAAMIWSSLVAWGVTQTFDLLSWRGLLIGLASWAALAAAPIGLFSIPRELRIKLSRHAFRQARKFPQR